MDSSIAHEEPDSMEEVPNDNKPSPDLTAASDPAPATATTVIEAAPDMNAINDAATAAEPMDKTRDVEEGPSLPSNEVQDIPAQDTQTALDVPASDIPVSGQSIDIDITTEGAAPSIAEETKKDEADKDIANLPVDAPVEPTVVMDLTEEPQVIDLVADPPTVASIVIEDDPLDVSKTEAVLHSSLALIANYGMSDDSDSDSESSSESSSSSSSSSSDSSDDEAVKVVDTVSYRNTVNVLSDDEDDGDNSDVELVGETPGEKKRPKKVIKAKGEMDVIDLPPIEDLNISVPEHECIELGKIMSVVDQLVIVESHLGNIALDLDTVLFLEKGKRTLGRIFDVLGQVNQPIYCVRFNSAEHIQEKEILPGMAVFYNNQRPEHTSVVVLPNLMRMKGSDASWENDIEPPQGCVEYSDDEEEREVRKARKTVNQKAIPEDPTNQRMKRVREPNNRQTRVRNNFAGPRQQNPQSQMPPRPQQPWMQNRPPNQWPAPQAGYGNDYANYSWHTYYQQQPHAPYPPSMYPPTGLPPPPPHMGPFYMNPYTQPAGPPPGHPPPHPQHGHWPSNNQNNYYPNGQGGPGGPGPSNGGRQFRNDRY